MSLDQMTRISGTIILELNQEFKEMMQIFQVGKYHWLVLFYLFVCRRG